MNTIATKTQLPVQQIVQWCGIARGKFYDWRKRCFRKQVLVAAT